MKSIKLFLIVICLLEAVNGTSYSQYPEEYPLWPDGIPGNPVVYKGEKARSENARNSSLSQKNRVFSCVSKPTFMIFKPQKISKTGAALVICPGGGFKDVWFDREGADLAIWLAQNGITSLVLKYRTFNPDEEGFTLKRQEYMPEVCADARQAIHILRSRAKELGLDEHKIGICGFSAGGSLSLRVALGMYPLPSYAGFTIENSNPDFAGLFYPGLDEELITLTGKKESISPVFIINGFEDKVTPAANCIELYKILLAKNFSGELHIYSKGVHGFDSGLDRGYGLSTWRDSFLAWMRDRKLVE